MAYGYFTKIVVLVGVFCALFGGSAGASIIQSGSIGLTFFNPSAPFPQSSPLQFSDGYSYIGSASTPQFTSVQCFAANPTCTISANYLLQLGSPTLGDGGFMTVTASSSVMPAFASGVQVFNLNFTAVGTLVNGTTFGVSPTPLPCDFPNPNTDPGSGLCSESFTGSGVASLTIERLIPPTGLGPGVYNLTSTQLTFTSSTPETATFAMTGTLLILASLWGHRYWDRRRCG